MRYFVKGMAARWSCVLLSAMAGAIASAQDSPAVKVIHERYREVVLSGKVLSKREGQVLHDQLGVLPLERDKLDDETLGQVLALETMVPLAAGDAAAAVNKYEALRERLPEADVTLRIGYLVGMAAGDGQLVQQSLRAMRAHADSARRRVISRRRRCTRRVGQRSPQVVIRAGELDEFDTLDRGDRVLVIHFWNMKDAAGQDADAPLAALYAWCKQHGKIDFVGVDADDEGDYEKARVFAAEHGYTWPQRYEGKSRKATITHEAFHIGSPPWLVVIDSYGYIRAAGDADDPALAYAIRVAAAEASGQVARVVPRTRDGKRPQVSDATAEDGAAAKTRPRKELRSDPQAASLLRQARAFAKAGLKTKAKALFQQIIRDYPDTIEAKKATEYLQDLP